MDHDVLGSEVDCSLTLEFTPVKLTSLAMTPRVGVLSTFLLLLPFYTQTTCTNVVVDLHRPTMPESRSCRIVLSTASHRRSNTLFEMEILLVMLAASISALHTSRFVAIALALRLTCADSDATIGREFAHGFEGGCPIIWKRLYIRLT